LSTRGRFTTTSTSRKPKPEAKDQDGHLAELELGQAARRSRLATRSRLSEISRRTSFFQTAGCC
jgi:hypothetical protein